MRVGFINQENKTKEPTDETTDDNADDISCDREPEQMLIFLTVIPHFCYNYFADVHKEFLIIAGANPGFPRGGANP